MAPPKNQCPICGKPALEKLKPFCSSRCATLDLGKWLGEGYRLEAHDDPEESEGLPLFGADEERE